jgi:ABC-type branched-subunit amino acid transport system substrate-binding protein
MLSLLLAVVSWLPVPQEPIKLGIVAEDGADSRDVAFLRGARRAIEAQNQKGGVDGSKLELVVVPAAAPGDLAAAITSLQAAAVVGVVAPVEPWLADPLRKACAGKLPCVSFSATTAAALPHVDRLLQHHLCFTKVGFVRDASKEAKELGKQLQKPGAGFGFTAPASVVVEYEVTIAAKALAKLYEAGRPELLLIDAEPAAVAKFLGQTLAGDRTPVVLTPRSSGAPVAALGRELFVVQGVSPGCMAMTSQFRSDYERDHGVPGYGAAEGFEAVTALARAVDAANSREPAAVTGALAGVVLEGIRGRCAFDPAVGAFPAPLGIWLLAGPRPQPYVPTVVPLQAVGDSVGTAPVEERKPQAQVGEPWGKWRSRQFVPEEGAQWVICEWASDAGFASSGDDLQQLGLSTGGADPVLDHLVREEIMARVMAIASTKFGRNDDGSGVAGKSLRIAFGMHVDPKVREKKKQRVWPALFGGDHSGAGGEAFGTYCRVYTSFIRRTIFQPHALKPALTAADRPYLDGTYRFGTDFAQDKRSELIRALINGYAGSMALTLAHEVGHLAGLDHVTDDPVEIMNVNEGGGIDYRDAHFGAASLASMRERYGLTGDKPGKGEKPAKGR